MANVYLPQRLLVEAADYFCRPGQPNRAEPASKLVLRDDTIASTVVSMVNVLAGEGVELYAEQAARWLATQLTWVHGGHDPAQDHRSPGLMSDARLAYVLDFLTANYSRPLTIADMARVAGVSPFHFCRMFRNAVGVSPQRYLTERRMIAGQRLLETTELTIGEIADACSYSRPTAFSTAFARQFGVSPTAYRARRR